MGPETKTCQNCKQEFRIELEDFAFYEKIQVPPPTWCPECRMIRRMSFRNERTIYRRKCALCGKDKISVYRPDSPYKVYCYDCFYSDDWDQLESGREYDFLRPFFEQYRELALRAPKLGLQASHDLVNTEYGNHFAGDKNCYLVFASIHDEDSMYCNYVNYSRGIVDGLGILKSESCFESVDCQNCSNLKFSQQCQDSLNGSFLYNCKGSSNCFMCSNLVRKSYCVRNRQYTKEEYQKMIDNLDLGSEAETEKLRNEFEEMREKAVKKAVEGFNHEGSTGNYLTNTKNCIQCFDVSSSENCKYVGYGNEAKDTMDAYAAYTTSELCYETVGSGAPAYNAKFCYLPWTGSNLTYCINAFSGCHNCFGCNHIHNKEYCILNKQYTKEEYETLVPRIIQHMKDMPYTDKKGRTYAYGEFFPPDLSPFVYNETIAQQHFPVTKEGAELQGYRWRNDESRNYGVTKKASDFPDNIRNADDSILNEVIGCAHNQTCNEQCTQAFKVLKDELEFYRKFNLPLPRLCPNCRHYRRLRQRTPMRLWHRSCICDLKNHFHGQGKCPNEFETSYAPDRKEIVYCEQCFNAEVV